MIISVEVADQFQEPQPVTLKLQETKLGLKINPCEKVTEELLLKIADPTFSFLA